MTPLLPASPVPGRSRGRARPAGPAGPGVPLSVWPCLPVPAAAGRLIGSFSRPGDLVAAAGGCPAVTGAARAAGRTAVALVPDGGGYPPPVLYPAVRLAGGPARLPAPGTRVAGLAALAVAGCPGPGCCPGPGPGPDGGLLYAACERVLCPGGVLVVIIDDLEPGEAAGGTVAAARAAGLAYAQHVVLLRVAIDRDGLDPGPGPAQPGDARVHGGLLVFTKPGGPRP
jgi:hypothetical protein